MAPHTDTPITILVVDDHRAVRDGLVALLMAHDDLRVIAEATNGDDAVQAWDTHRPDITLMDLKMPVMDGLTATRRILAHEPAARIILVTTFAGDPDIERALDAGARRVLLKDQLRSTVVTVVRDVHRG